MLSRLKRKFSRVSSGKLITEIDGLRFFAILPVVAYHISETFRNKLHPNIVAEPSLLADALKNGGLGVQLFFAISGFILAKPYAESVLFGASAPSYGSYVKKRLLRLEPPYLIALTLKLFMLAVLAAQPGLVANWLVSALYLNSIIYGEPSKILVAAWSLEIELQFYLIAPFVARAYFQQSATVRRGAAALVIFGGLVCSSIGGRLGYMLPGQMHFFAVGFLMLDFYLHRSQRSRLFDAGLVFAFVWLVWLRGEQGIHLVRSAGDVLVIAATFTACLWGARFNRVCSNGLLSTIGAMCYTIYLFHGPMISLFMNRGSGKFAIGSSYTFNLLLQLVVVSAVVFAVSALLFVFLERPFMKRDWPSRFSGFVRGLRPAALRSTGEPSETESSLAEAERDAMAVVSADEHRSATANARLRHRGDKS